MRTYITGAGPFEWVWAAISSGDITVLRAAPASFDISSTHSKYGAVLTAFLSGLLNLQGRFFNCADRTRLAQDIVTELGRRGARPDLVIHSANFKVKSLYHEWHLVGDLTAMQVMIEIRDSLLEHSVNPDASELVEEADKGDAEILDQLLNLFAELAAQGDLLAARTPIPDAVVNIWERFLKNTAEADVTIVCTDGQTRAQSSYLMQASPVLAAMLTSGMREGQRLEIPVQQPLRVVDLFLTLIHTGCLPQEPIATCPTLEVGTHVVIGIAFVSNSATSIFLPAGLEGEVQNIDNKGDALIKFDGISTRQWVWKKNFVRLYTRVAEDAILLHQGLAGALALAHYWQVDGLAEVLTERLQRHLSAENFEAVLEVAELHENSCLRGACLAFAHHSAKVRAAFDAKSYSKVVLGVLQSLFMGGAVKRPREGL